MSFSLPPKVSLAVLPTRLERLDRYSARLGRNVWIKRDDLTGLATGGNKTRMFEYVLGEAVKQGADTVIGGAAGQSNYCRQRYLTRHSELASLLQHLSHLSWLPFHDLEMLPNQYPDGLVL